jgi:hypothetical protein
MKDLLSVAGALGARRKILVIGLLAALIAIVSAWVWYRNAHPSIDEAWQTHIFPEYDENLTLKRATGKNSMWT